MEEARRKRAEEISSARKTPSLRPLKTAWSSAGSTILEQMDVDAARVGGPAEMQLIQYQGANRCDDGGYMYDVGKHE